MAERVERKQRRGGLWKPLLLLFCISMCVGSLAFTAFVDQAGVLAIAYIRAANSGNSGAAELMGDHFSDEQGFNRRMYLVDFARDAAYLDGAELSGVNAERVQTLSGQWATVLRFKYRARGSSGAWTSAGLRVKTDTWLILTYIRAVEPVAP